MTSNRGSSREGRSLLDRHLWGGELSQQDCARLGGAGVHSPRIMDLWWGEFDLTAGGPPPRFRMRHDFRREAVVGEKEHAAALRVPDLKLSRVLHASSKPACQHSGNRTEAAFAIGRRPNVA